MRLGRSRGYMLVVIAASCGAAMIAPGCSQDEDPNAAADISPFDPKPPGKLEAKGSSPGGLEVPLPGETAASTRKSDDPLTGLALPGKSTLDTRFGAGDVEKTLREAIRAARNGDKQLAAELLDQVLAAEPLNREALLSRAAIFFDDSRNDKSPAADRNAAIEKAVALARQLRKAIESPKANENALFSAVLYGYAQHLVQAGRLDDAIKALNESADSGFEPYFTVDKDEKMAEFRKSEKYQAALKAA